MLTATVQMVQLSQHHCRGMAKALCVLTLHSHCGKNCGGYRICFANDQQTPEGSADGSVGYHNVANIYKCLSRYLAILGKFGHR